MSKLDDRRRVVVVGALPPPVNGITRMCEAVLRSELARRWLLVHVDISDHRSLRSMGRLDARNVWLAVAHAWSLLRALRTRPALCYLPVAQTRLGFLRDAQFLLAARLAHVPRVVHFHGQGFAAFYANERRWMRALVRAALGGDTHAIVLGEGLRNEFVGLVPAAHVHPVANGIEDLGDAGTEQAEPLVLFLSHLGVRKGVFDFLEAAAIVHERVPDVRFTLAGDWYREDERRRGRAFVDAHGLGGVIDECGAVDEAAKRQLLAEASVLVLPSPAEGQSLVVLEALSRGTPVIATRVGALPETVEDGVEGFLVESGDAAAVADCLCRLLTDEGLRRGMSRAARLRYEQNFTIEAFAERIDIVWSHALRADLPHIDPVAVSETK